MRTAFFIYSQTFLLMRTEGGGQEGLNVRSGILDGKSARVGVYGIDFASHPDPVVSVPFQTSFKF